MSPEPSASIPATLGQVMGLFQTGSESLNLQVFLPVSLPYLKTYKNHAEIFVCMHIPALISSSKSPLFAKNIHSPLLMKVRSLNFQRSPAGGESDMQNTEWGTENIRKINQTTFHDIRELRTNIKMLLIQQQRSL